MGRLFDEIGTHANLVGALWAAARGKRDRPEVRSFLEKCEEHLNGIGARIRSGSYRFSPYRSFEVRDTKRRMIHAPAFIDRVVHHAIVRVVGPVMEAGACEHSYACRRGFGQHRALARAAEWTRRGGWYGKMDVRKFYDSVEHAVLMQRLGKRFREARLLRLFEVLLASYSTEPGRGLPIGALTSQYLGNFLLDTFDRDLTRMGLATHYLRYMDDSVVWARGPEQLAALRARARESLSSLGLALKHGGEWNRCEQGIPLLGFVVYPGRIRLGKSGRIRLRAKFARLSVQFRRGKVSEREAGNRSTSLFAHACVADDAAWRRVVLDFHDFGDEQGPSASAAGRRLDLHRGGVPRGVPQQERPWPAQQEQRVPARLGPRIGEVDASPDDAHSRAGKPHGVPDETAGKSPPRSETRRGARRKARGGAPGGSVDGFFPGWEPGT